jgi:hypothetical protein
MIRSNNQRSVKTESGSSNVTEGGSHKMTAPTPSPAMNRIAFVARTRWIGCNGPDLPPSGSYSERTPLLVRLCKS